MFLLPDNYSKKDFCEGCSFLGLYNSDKKCCILCGSEYPHEDDICKMKFVWKEFKYEKYIGYYLETIDAISKKYQMRSSSGGLITSLLCNMLEKGEIDYAICVWWSQKYWDFRYMKVNSVKELVYTQRSAYYPISLVHAIEILEKETGTCAITCTPSVAKAIEILKLENEEFKRKIKYTLGLTYNSTKKREYTEYLCKKAGKIDGMANADYISYRDKQINSGGDIISKNLGNFVVQQWSKIWELAPNQRSSDWSIGLLQEFSSNFVDDHYAECADISVMDAWHDNYKNKNGTSLAIVRNKKILLYIKEDSDIVSNNIPFNIILESQKSGINFKNNELSIRLKFYKFFYNIEVKSRVRPTWWKNYIRILRVLLRLYISLGTEKKYKKWKNIKKYVKFWWKIYHLLGKINILISKKYEKISSLLTIFRY